MPSPQDQKQKNDLMTIAEEEARQRKAEEEARLAQERLAAVENYNLDELLDALFADSRGLWNLERIPAAFRDRTLTTEQYQRFADRRYDIDDPIRARAFERLITIGAEILAEVALAPPPSPPTEEEIAAERERQIQAYLAKLATMHFLEVVNEANCIGLISPSAYGRLNSKMDFETRTAITEAFKKQLATETDPIRRGLLERLMQGDNAARVSVGSGPARHD